MIRKLLYLSAILAFPLMFATSCEENLLDEGDIYNSSENESFVENPLMDASATRLWTTPVAPNADGPLTISFKAGKTSALKGYTGDVYAHIGILEFGVWKYVQADWNVNLPHCKFTKDEKEPDTWHLELLPSIREYFQSGTTAVNQIGIVIRSADGSMKGIVEDRFINVTDDKYEPFEAVKSPEAPSPAGCDYGINVVDNSTVTFMLHDANTSKGHYDYAYIIGDFNDWTLSSDDKSHMSYDAVKGCWWITVTGLDPDKEYRFQYHLGNKAVEDGTADKIVRLSDPFSEKILDPNNDRWINYSHPIYPDEQMVYPEDGVGIVSCFKINRDPYQWTPFQMKNADCPVIYEMLLGDWTETADIAGAMKHLDYLQTLGVNAVELMPVQEFDGNESWGYNPNHYFALDKAYGTCEQYKDFIDACHQRGIAVFLDVVYNHSTGDSPLAKMYWDPDHKPYSATSDLNPYFNVNAKHPFNVFHDINHDNLFMRDVVKRSLKYLITEYNVDGFRFDLSKGFTQSSSAWDQTSTERINLIKEYAAAIREADPDSYIILEHWGTSDEERQYVQAGIHPWRKMNGPYIKTAEGNGNSGDANLSGSYDAQYPTGWVVFMESHDEERMAYKQNKYGAGNVAVSLQAKMENLALNAVLLLGVPGPKMIWQMGELGYDYNKWCTPDGVDKTDSKEYETSRKPVKWDYYDVPERRVLYNVYCRMNQLRNNNPELFGASSSFTWNPFGWPLKTMNLDRDGKEVRVFANYHGVNAASQDVTIPSGTWTDYLTGETVSGGSYTLASGKALVLVNSSVK